MMLLQPKVIRPVNKGKYKIVHYTPFTISANMKSSAILLDPQKHPETEVY